MILALVPHWTALDAIGIWAEVIAVLALVVLVPWARDRTSRPRPPTTEPITGVTIQSRSTQPYDTPAWSAGEHPGEEPS